MVDRSQPEAHCLCQAWLDETLSGIQKLQQAAARTHEAAAAASAAAAACHRRSIGPAAHAHVPACNTAAALETSVDGMQRTSSSSSTLSHLSGSNAGFGMQKQHWHGSSISMHTHSTQPTDDSMETASAASDVGSEDPAHAQHASPDIKVHLWVLMIWTAPITRSRRNWAQHAFAMPPAPCL